MKVIAKLIKVKSFNSFSVTPIDTVFEGYFYEWPCLEKSFSFLHLYDNIEMKFKPLFTTIVNEIIDNRTFKTKNSIYKIVTIGDERDKKIKNILDV